MTNFESFFAGISFATFALFLCYILVTNFAPEETPPEPTNTCIRV